MEQRRLGSDGPLVSALGIGSLGMAGRYGPSDEAESLATLHAALDAGVTLLDTGDFYGVGSTEQLIGRALRGRRREQTALSVKFGMLCEPGGEWRRLDTRPEMVRHSLAYTLRRLGTDYVDVYRPARCDPDVPVEETVGAISEMVSAGYVRFVGLSEVDADTLRRAHETHPISDLQIEYSLLSRDIEGGLLQLARQLGVGITAYGVLSRGLLTGRRPEDRDGDVRAVFPRFQGDNLEHNLTLVHRLQAVAEARGMTTSQLAIAWVLAQGADIVPVVGARSRTQLAETLRAGGLGLSAEDLAAVERAIPAGSAAGDRYPRGPVPSSDDKP
ncbi:aldo/keto reductase [Streptomyces marispadix]|uniref:Aldo/keto reductase n=1 Tax=Streptomyces marispadix TaxID=2922868 RepID=A0ABS9SUG4_9ACTN|nr:aldo/keto reductase [Streptomyces marispadix]MCH6159935.1 aldo/keto reductase [Streptomyces marispadix]